MQLQELAVPSAKAQAPAPLHRRPGNPFRHDQDLGRVSPQHDGAPPRARTSVTMRACEAMATACSLSSVRVYVHPLS